MNRETRIALAMTVVLSCAAGAFAALSPQVAEFGNSPAKWLMTRDEAERWKEMETDAEARDFIELFWLRRDPTPGTPANEFRDEFNARVKYADEHFAQPRTRGAMTDRGRVLIVLGPPVRMERTSPDFSANRPMSAQEMHDQATTGARGSGPGYMPMDETIVEGAKAAQLWRYEQARTKTQLGQPALDVYFRDDHNTNDWRLANLERGGTYTALFERVNQSGIVNPTATLTRTETRTTTTANSAVTTIVETATGAVTAAAKASLAYAEFVSPAGEAYVPIAMVVEKRSPEDADTISVTVTDGSGAVVQRFTEPAQLLASNGNLVAERTLTLPSGRYTAVVGLAKGGQPVATARTALDVGKSPAGVSKLVLSKDVHELADAAPVKAPYAFGKLKVVPQADLTFTNRDELSYFVELQHPGIDPESNLPKLQVQLEVSGAKLTAPITAPAAAIDALPLSGNGGPGQYAIISSIPLGEMKTPLAPGDYTLKVNIVDTVTKQTYNLEQSFKIAG